MKNKKFYILHFTFFILLLILLLSCSSPTESSTGSLSGTINLEDQTDHSGIVIGVYNLVELDTTITRINAEYPQNGIV